MLKEFIKSKRLAAFYFHGVVEYAGIYDMLIGDNDMARTVVLITFTMCLMASKAMDMKKEKKKG